MFCYLCIKCKKKKMKQDKTRFLIDKLFRMVISNIYMTHSILHWVHYNFIYFYEIAPNGKPTCAELMSQGSSSGLLNFRSPKAESLLKITKTKRLNRHTAFCIMFMRSSLMVWTYSTMLILPVFCPCLWRASRAMKVPVRPIPALGIQDWFFKYTGVPSRVVLLFFKFISWIFSWL